MGRLCTESGNIEVKSRNLEAIRFAPPGRLVAQSEGPFLDKGVFPGITGVFTIRCAAIVEGGVGLALNSEPPAEQKIYGSVIKYDY